MTPTLEQLQDAARRGLFWPKVDRSAGPAGCWPWLASGTGRRQRYGQFQLWDQGKRWGILAHRAAWMLTHGPIPDGMVIDHVAAAGCTTMRCVNPGHLEPVSNRENLARARAVGIMPGRRRRQVVAS